MCSDPEFSTRFFMGGLGGGLVLALAGCAQTPVTPPASSATAQQQSEPQKAGRCLMQVVPDDALQILQTLPHGYRSKTVLRFLIGADGKVREVVLVKSSGFKSLDRAAESSLRACQFEPPVKDGEPAEKWEPVDYEWSAE
jgi:protein TonB